MVSKVENNELQKKLFNNGKKWKFTHSLYVKTYYINCTGDI